MKAAGKCGAGQSTTGRTFKKSTKSTSNVELEHAIKSSTGEESPGQDMSKMRAAGKCGSN